MNWKEGRKVSEDRERPGELGLEKQVRACWSWMGPQRWQPVLFFGAQRSDGQAQLIQRVGTFCFLISFQCLILGEDTAGERCRDSKRKKETSLDWIPGRRLKSKLEPLYFSSLGCQNSSKSKRKIGMAGSQYGFLKCPNGLWSLK